MLASAQIERMSVAEKFEALEQIWESLRREVPEMPSPDWHREVLAERKARAERGESKFLTLDELRHRLVHSK